MSLNLMPLQYGVLPGLLLILGMGTAGIVEDAPGIMQVTPTPITFRNATERVQLLVDDNSSRDGTVDATSRATFRSLNLGVIDVSTSGVIIPLSDGDSEIEVNFGDQSQRVAVSVKGLSLPRSFHFENDIVPMLIKFGCSTSACHAKAEGQGGFKLSVFGFDPESDYQALLMEGRGRRVFLTSPEQSLFLRKATGGIPHGGGVRISRDSSDYSLLRDWVAAGAPFGSTSAPILVGIEVQPHERQLHMGSRQQLRVVARYSDNQQVDVTSMARFLTNNEDIAQVDARGQVMAGHVPGRVAVMASFMSEIDTFSAYVPNAVAISPETAWTESNVIDRLVHENLRKLNIAPSPAADDEEFLRRVSLDIIGTLPSASIARQFLSDQRPDKRAKLVDELLRAPEYADYWTLKWSDLLLVDRGRLGTEGAFSYSQWIQQRISENQPLDQFARDLIVAEGPLAEVPEAHLYKVTKDAGEMARTVSQVFMGVRIACAQCHHHPYDRWSQTDYYGMVDFFAQVGTHSTPRGDMVLESDAKPTLHPRTGDPVAAHPLGTTTPREAPGAGRRVALAEWMTRADNPWFAHNLANRIWAHLLGRGIVEPVDDVRATNPPSNPQLLQALADYLVEHHYDQQALIRLIVASQTYGRSSSPNESNRRDDTNYSRALLKRIDSEVLLDAVCQTTGVSEKFYGMPDGYRAIQLWDSNVPHYFLKLFGRPQRETACTCERASEPSVGQVLHMLNAPSIQEKLSHRGGRIARLTAEHTGDDELADELYLTFLSRFPTGDERAVAVNHLRGPDLSRTSAAEDLAWSLMNSLEFVFNH